ncbi:fungal specific transcription factor [Pseudohyphozyma bogoriensis]|nr:fungal specific transcription factor [Pseudohyphozyma bogoriensis]
MKRFANESTWSSSGSDDEFCPPPPKARAAVAAGGGGGNPKRTGGKGRKRDRRQKKVKCDRSTNCANCKLRGQTCYYSGALPISTAEDDELQVAKDEIVRLKALVAVLAQDRGVLLSLDDNEIPDRPPSDYLPSTSTASTTSSPPPLPPVQPLEPVPTTRDTSLWTTSPQQPQLGHQPQSFPMYQPTFHQTPSIQPATESWTAPPQYPSLPTQYTFNFTSAPFSHPFPSSSPASIAPHPHNNASLYPSFQNLFPPTPSPKPVKSVPKPAPVVSSDTQPQTTLGNAYSTPSGQMAQWGTTAVEQTLWDLLEPGRSSV